MSAPAPDNQRATRTSGAPAGLRVSIDDGQPEDAQGNGTHRRLRLLVLLLIAVVAPLATAQNPISPRGAERSPGCLPSASRAKESCDPDQVVVRSEKEVTFSFELPPVKTAQCATTIEVAYIQRGTTVSVEGTIENKDCGTSSGDYNLVVSVRDENRELKTLEFLESWERQNDEPVKFTGTYPIGENVDLVRVRPVQLHCTCAEASKE